MSRLHGHLLTNVKFRIISIDPGAGKAGYSVLEYDFEKEKFKVIYANTRTGDQLSNLFFDKTYKDIHGERITRNRAHNIFLSLLLKKYKPQLVVTEAAYVGKFVNAYKSLTEHLTLLKAAVYTYDSEMEYGMIEPSKVKKAMGVNGKSGDKTLMQKALEKRKDVSYNDGIKPKSFDEHTVDAICIGITACKIVHVNLNKKLKDKKRVSKK